MRIQRRASTARGRSSAGTSVPSTTDSRGWVTSLGTQRDESRQGVLVVADDPLSNAVSELARSKGYEVYAAGTPLGAIQILERLGQRIGHAILSSALSWGQELRALIAEDYPDVRRIVLVG